MDDNRFSQMYSLYYAVNSKPGSEEPVWLDRDPEETARIRAEREALIDIDDKIDAFFAAYVIDDDA